MPVTKTGYSIPQTAQKTIKSIVSEFQDISKSEPQKNIVLNDSFAKITDIIGNNTNALGEHPRFGIKHKKSLKGDVLQIKLNGKKAKDTVSVFDSAKDFPEHVAKMLSSLIPSA